MNITTVAMPQDMTKRTRQAMALLVGLAMLLSTGARAQIPTVDLGRAISVIVSKFNPSDPRPERVVERVGGTVGEPLRIVDGFEATVPENMIASLANTPGIRSVTPNRPVGSRPVRREHRRRQRGLHRGRQGQPGVGNGFDGKRHQRRHHRHRRRGGRRPGGARFSYAEDFSIEAGTADRNRDTYGHGTFVAGLIAGTGRSSNGAVMGVAPGSTIVSVKIAGRDGSTDVVRLLAALE